MGGFKECAPDARENFGGFKGGAPDAKSKLIFRSLSIFKTNFWKLEHVQHKFLRTCARVCVCVCARVCARVCESVCVCVRLSLRPCFSSQPLDNVDDGFRERLNFLGEWNSSPPPHPPPNPPIKLQLALSLHTCIHAYIHRRLGVQTPANRFVSSRSHHARTQGEVFRWRAVLDQNVPGCVCVCLSRPGLFCCSADSVVFLWGFWIQQPESLIKHWLPYRFCCCTAVKRVDICAIVVCENTLFSRIYGFFAREKTRVGARCFCTWTHEGFKAHAHFAREKWCLLMQMWFLHMKTTLSNRTKPL